MQNPNEDTEWNDVLRAKGILPPKEDATITEDAVIQVRDSARNIKLMCGFKSIAG